MGKFAEANAQGAVGANATLIFRNHSALSGPWSMQERRERAVKEPCKGIGSRDVLLNTGREITSNSAKYLSTLK